MATDRALGANAETAQELAPALLKFQTHVPEAATEVSALVSELYAISAALLELKTASNEQRNFRNRKSVDQDKYVVLQSLEYTFKDINHFIRATDNRTYRSDREAFKDVWIQIDTHFRNESNNSLLARLGYYKQFIDGLTPIVHGYVSHHPVPHRSLMLFPGDPRVPMLTIFTTASASYLVSKTKGSARILRISH